jgi:hypothetical protein
MTRKHPAFPSPGTIFFFLLLCATQTPAQSSNSRPRITQPVDETNLVVLHGNTYPLARPEYSTTAPTLSASRMAVPSLQPIQAMQPHKSLVESPGYQATKMRALE